jgi:hypothetical protein
MFPVLLVVVEANDVVPSKSSGEGKRSLCHVLLVMNDLLHGISDLQENIDTVRGEYIHWACVQVTKNECVNAL